MAIVAIAFGIFLKLFRCSRRISLALNIAFVLGYLVFAGIPISAMRASVMVIMSLAAGVFGRRGASLNALAVCIIAFISISPVTSVSVSFFLSAGSTLGIILFSPLISSWFGKGVIRSEKTEAIGKGVTEPLALTFSANIVTMPYSVAMFSMLPIISPIANIIATPLFTIACVSGLVAALISCSITPLAPIFIPIASALAFPLYISVDFLSKIPYCNISVEADVLEALIFSAVASLLLWVFWPKSPKKILLCSCIVLTLVASSFLTRFFTIHGDEIVMLDVGQGDSFLVRSGSSSVLIDTGNQDVKLVKGLADEGVMHLNALVITHPDDDHCGALTSLLSVVKIDRLVIAADLLECTCKNCTSLIKEVQLQSSIEISGLELGDSINFGNIKITTIWPKDFKDEGGNADSLCFLASIDVDSDKKADWSALFTGDAESAELKEIISSGSVGDIDILKVGHHGSKISLDEDVLKALRPEFALISVGANNRYGHPTQTTIDLLENAKTKILRTDKDGKVRLSFTKDAILVE